MKRQLKWFLSGFFLAAWGLYAIGVGGLTTFSPKTPIKASEVNNNFKALNDGKQERIGGSCAAATAIREIKTDGSVDCVSISGGPGGAGDISGVTAGAGLSGGGSSGEVTLSLADAGVSTVKLADKSVTGAKLASPLSLTGPDTLLFLANQSPESTAIFMASGGNATAVDGRSNSGPAVYGQGRIGVYGRSSSPTDPGVFGFHSGENNGVTGRSTNAKGAGVFGDNTSSGIGIYGKSTSGLSAKFEGGSGGLGTCTYNGGADWVCTSDKNAKENFRSVDSEEILESLSQLPISYWNMKGDRRRTPHIGPTAQDFYLAFGLGQDNQTINRADVQGVALAAIQALHRENQELKLRLSELEARLARLEQAR